MNELREKIQNVLINDYGPTVTIVISDKSVDAILDAVIAALPEEATLSSGVFDAEGDALMSVDAFNEAIDQVKGILEAAKSHPVGEGESWVKS